MPLDANAVREYVDAVDLAIAGQGRSYADVVNGQLSEQRNALLAALDEEGVEASEQPVPEEGPAPGPGADVDGNGTGETGPAPATVAPAKSRK